MHPYQNERAERFLGHVEELGLLPPVPGRGAAVSAPLSDLKVMHSNTDCRTIYYVSPARPEQNALSA